MQITNLEWKWAHHKSELCFRNAWTAAGYPSDFIKFGSDIRIDQSVKVATAYHSNLEVAHGIYFETTNEVGLWVAPDYRSNGIGTQCFGTLLAHCAAQTDALYAITEQRNAWRLSMERILTRFEFVRTGPETETQLWFAKTRAIMRHITPAP